jgi:hypothetical protein
MAQSFFEAGENRLLIAGLDIDHAVRRQARLRERRGEKILTDDAPQDLAARPRRDASCEKRGCRAVNRAIAAARRLMQRSERQSPSRQTPIDLLDPERQHRATVRASAFKALNAFAKLGDDRTDGGSVHRQKAPPSGLPTASLE